MHMGSRRYGADICSGAGSQASHGIIPLQSGLLLSQLPNVFILSWIVQGVDCWCAWFYRSFRSDFYNKLGRFNAAIVLNS